MNWMDPTRKVLAGASVALSICFSSMAQAEAPCRPYYQCPPGYRHMAPSGGQYYSPTPSQGTQGQGTPTPANPDMTSPSDMGQQPPAPGDQTQQQQQQQQPDFTPSPDTSSRASLAPGANTPQLGRMDQANRLNLFDNMTAAPMNRVWFGLQYASGINTGLYQTSFDPLTTGFTDRQKQIIYRAGGEVMLTCDASVAVQGQYYTNETHDGPLGGFNDDFTNPQVLFKYVLARDCDTILSATLGVTIDTGADQGDFNEDTTKLYPGMLYYETLGSGVFTQGGFQFGIPTEHDQITTFDWSVSLGYWLYQDCSLSQGCCCCNKGRITGLIPQVNLLGKHVIGDDTRSNAFGLGYLNSTVLLGNPLIYNEPNDVLDLSVGGLILIGCDIQVGAGYSFPITSQETRDNEFLTYVNYLF